MVNGRALRLEAGRGDSRDAQDFEPDLKEAPLRTALLGAASARCRQAAQTLLVVLTPAPLIMMRTTEGRMQLTVDAHAPLDHISDDAHTEICSDLRLMYVETPFG